MKEVKEGDVVIYHDETGTPFNALVTSGGYEYSDDKSTCWINVLFVSDDVTKKDNYGRQIERSSSVSHVSKTSAWGRYWRWPEETPNLLSKNNKELS